MGGVIADIDQGRGYLGEGSLDGRQQTIPALYNLPSTDFHDITSGNNGFYAAGTGYDLVTGLGSPVVPRIVDDMVGNGITGAWFGSAATVVPVAQIPRNATHFATQKIAAANSPITSSITGGDDGDILKGKFHLPHAQLTLS